MVLFHLFLSVIFAGRKSGGAAEEEGKRVRFSHPPRPNNQRGGFYHEKDIEKSAQPAAHTHADVQRSYDVPEYSFGDGE